MFIITKWKQNPTRVGFLIKTVLQPLAEPELQGRTATKASSLRLRGIVAQPVKPEQKFSGGCRNVVNLLFVSKRQR